MLKKNTPRLAGGDKSSFAAKRRVIQPMSSSPSAPAHLIPYAFTTDALKESRDWKFFSSGPVAREILDVQRQLGGERSRQEVLTAKDKDFEALAKFVSGARHDDMITGRRFQEVYNALTENDDVIIWLCMTAMAILNPGDVRSRLLRGHLEALLQAVAAGEMSDRVAFRFYESAVRSPAYRQIAAQQLETGASTRLAGLCAAADAMRKLGVTRRPMASYFELYHRITERSEAMSPWGFPPLFQFEERLALEKRLRFFGRPQAEDMKKKAKRGSLAPRKYMRSRIFWIPPTWKWSKTYVGPRWVKFPGIIPD